MFRERGFAVSEEVYDNYSNEKVNDEEKYEEDLHMEDFNIMRRKRSLKNLQR